MLDGGGDPRTELGTGDLLAVERGLAGPVLAVEDELSWSVTVWAGLTTSRPASVERAARLLAEQARALTALGAVEVVLSEGGIAEPLGAPTRDADELRQVLADLEAEAGGAGELLELRSSFRQQLAAASSAGERQRLAADGLRQELLLLGDESTTLLAWLADATPGAATASSGERSRLLLLLADVTAEVATDLYAEPTARSGGAVEQLAAEAASLPDLAPLLAAAGWTTVPLVTPGSTRDAFAELARVTGGELVDDAASLSGALARLSRRVGVRVAIGDDDDGRPYPFALRLARGEGSVTAAEWASSVEPEGLSAARASRLLLDEEAAGPLPIVASLRLDESPAGSRHDGERATVEALLPVAGLVDGRSGRGAPSTSSLRTTLVLERIDGRPLILHRLGSGRDLSRAEHLLLRATVPLSEEIDRVGVLVEDLAGAAWGGAIAELAEEPLRAGGGLLVSEVLDLAPGDSPSSAGEAPSQRGTLVRLLPPREHPATGRQRFQVLVTSPAVDAVDFYLDGEKRTSDGRSPFSATLDLGGEVIAHTIRVVALDRTGLAVGSDEMRLNADDGAFHVSFVDVRPTPEAVDVEAQVFLPPGSRLDRVELFYNDGLATLLDGPPYRARISRTAPGGDYVTVVAHLTDGSRAEDVRLLDAPGIVERVDVNLVQLYVVVTDRGGQPVRDLTAEDFRILLGGEPRTIERFAAADEVPLFLGLMIDSSMSMGTIMHETKMAAIRFLGDILSEDDRSFIVDFADRPRLVQTTTGELFTLVSSVGRLEPSGSNTALYDAIVFSLLQFGDEPGRKALVLLSDGDDVNSRFGYRRVYETAGAAGLPIYILGIAGLDPDRPSFRKSDLEGIAARSGGRVFYIDDQSQLGTAYDTIAAELRSQYLLTFTTDRELSDEEAAKIRVEVPGRRFEVRTVVGDR